MMPSGQGLPRRSIPAAPVCAAMLVGMLVGVGQAPARAANPVTSVSGSAFSFYTNVGLFQGPRSRRGYGTTAQRSEGSYSPSVTLPPGGSSAPVTDEKARGTAGWYGPAMIFGSIYK